MDIICTRCGEPWDVDYVRHEEPDEFERRGGVITVCPCCRNKPVKLSKETKERLAAVREIAGLLGDDIDGLAATLEDFDLL